MKKTLIIALTTVMLCFAATTVSAQQYGSAIGLRAGYPFGLTFKTQTGKVPGFELIVGGRGYRTIEFIGLAEFHTYPAATDNFTLYFGFGGHVGFYGDNNPYFDASDEVGVGADGIIGIGYAFDEAPVDLSLDWKPGFNFVGPNGFLYGDGAVSIRYILNR